MPVPVLQQMNMLDAQQSCSFAQLGFADCRQLVWRANGRVSRLSFLSPGGAAQGQTNTLSAILAGDAGDAKAFVVGMSKAEENAVFGFQGSSTCDHKTPRRPSSSVSCYGCQLGAGTLSLNAVDRSKC